MIPCEVLWNDTDRMHCRFVLSDVDVMPCDSRPGDKSDTLPLVKFMSGGSLQGDADPLPSRFYAI